MIEGSVLLAVGMILLMLGLCLISIPIAASMGIVGVIFSVILYRDMSSVYLASLTAWSNVASYTFSMIPLFLLMGELIGKSGLGQEAYSSVYKIFSKLPGGLAIVSTVACAIFACITGSSASTIVTIGSIAIPEMKKHNYSNTLRTGAIACSGCLANLIPPSMAAIIFCILTEVSVGRVFMGGLIPGIILAVLFIITILIIVRIRPDSAPATNETFTFKEKIISLKAPLPIIFIFLVMAGGIYNGTFSATEAAGIGVVTSLLVIITQRRFTWQVLKDSVGNSVRTTSMLVAILMGAMLFSHAVALAKLPDAVAYYISDFLVSPIIGISVIVGIFIVFGCILDVFGLLVLFVPLFFPAVIKMGWDPVWFGVLIVVLVEMALITPPIATNIYVTASIDPDSTTMDVIKGVIPFYGAVLLLIVLLICFPQIALWLPSMM